MLRDPRVLGDLYDRGSFPYSENRLCVRVKAICSSGLCERDHRERLRQDV